MSVKDMSLRSLRLPYFPQNSCSAFTPILSTASAALEISLVTWMRMQRQLPAISRSATVRAPRRAKVAGKLV